MRRVAVDHQKEMRAARGGAGAWVVFVLAVLAFAGFAAALLWGGGGRGTGGEGANVHTPGPLVVHVGAALRAPMEKIRAEFEREAGQKVEITYGASQTLLTQAEVSKIGDVYIPADDSYIELARKKDLIAEVMPIASMNAVVAVAKGNPKGITSFDDLLRDGTRLGQANPDAAAIGKVTRDALEKVGKWESLKAHTAVFKGTVTDVANDLRAGALDAAILWDAMVRQQSAKMDAVLLPELAGAKANIAAAVLKFSRQPTAAIRFTRYVSARDRGLKHFADDGYVVAAGDEWTDTPELRLLAGAMLRPAIDETLKAFEQREGVRITRVYNGCGILVGQMKAGERPDAYFACEPSFMQQVSDLFLDAETISQNQLVIIVPKGNPHHIKTLRDLGKPGIRLGVGHEKQCALGALTKTTLEESGLYAPLRKNVAVESPTGDFLVNQLRAGSLDAVIAYISNAAASGDKVEAIAIDIPCALALQPIAVGKATRYPNTMARLVEAIKSAESREKFTAEGFVWKAKEHGR